MSLAPFEGEPGTRVDPLPDRTFDDFETGAIVPVPRYRGAVSWVFPESARPRGDRR